MRPCTAKAEITKKCDFLLYKSAHETIKTDMKPSKLIETDHANRFLARFCISKGLIELFFRSRPRVVIAPSIVDRLANEKEEQAAVADQEAKSLA